MMRAMLCLMLVAGLAACTDPRLDAALSLGPGGVQVYPSVSAGLGGGGRIAYSPP